MKLKVRTLAFPLFLFTFLSVMPVAAQGDSIWTPINESASSARNESEINATVFKTFRLNKTTLRSLLAQAPQEFTESARGDGAIITIPMPDGSLERFRFERSPIVEPGLLEKYPQLGNTFRGAGIDDPTATARFDLLPSGFHAIVISAAGTTLVDPFSKDDSDRYIAYDKASVPRSGEFSCGFDSQNAVDSISTPSDPARFDFVPDAAPELTSGSQLRTYRLALAATNEYAVAVGGNTIAGTLAAQVLIMNRVNGVYERDVAIRMIIVANNDRIVYAGDQMCNGVACTATNDPYSNTSPTTLLSENQMNLDSVIQTANYDVGHVFSTGGGGVATLNGPCNPSSKARGETGLSNPVGDPFAIDYVAHELGHQWGGYHTFNGAVSNCSGGNRSSSAAYEPGSGVTIMAYAGICGNQNLARNSIDTFHVKSLEQIVAYSQTGLGNSCAMITPSGNTPPTVSVVGGPIFNIPKQTPFALTASATDADNDSVTYDWQEYDLGPATTAVPNSDAAGAIPIFRPFLPTTSGTRYFPAMQYTLANANVPPATYGSNLLTGELLPAIARTMTFQVIARDNRAGTGGINTATATVNVDGNSGPFKLTAPNTGVTWAAGSTQTVAWDVANTAALPVAAANVKIMLSADGGQTYTNLAASTANDGSETVTIPNIATTQARIKIEAIGNIFYDVSDADFTIGTSTAAGSKRFDFDGDGKADVSVYRGGAWYVLQSQAGFSGYNFGTATDKTVAADFDGDGKTDYAVFRDGTWYVQRSQAGFYAVQFGQAGDTPVAGDFTGDGKADLTVFRSGVWYTLNPASGNVTYTQFGSAGDRPQAGDWDGDGKQDPAVYRNGSWYVLGSQQGFISLNFGLASDIPVPADYDGDAKTDFAVYRNGVWYLQQSTAGFAATNFGISTDVPAPADFDGDGKADVAVFRGGAWYQLRSLTGFYAVQFGQSGDKPVPAQNNQ